MTTRSRVEPSSQAASNRMRANRSRDTKPELRLRSELHRRGHRFRIDFKPAESLRTRADIVFTRMRVAVFVDGCFWHGCPEHGTSPRSNARFWREKIETNRRRDQRITKELMRLGWDVIRVWEHETAIVAADQVCQALKRRSERSRSSTAFPQ